MKKYVSAMVLWAAFAVPAFADCARPTAPGNIPDGDKATMEDMMATKKAVDAYKRDLLLVPTNKSLVGPVSPPNNNLINVDHYKCYKAKTTPGTNRFPATTVNLSDQFQSPAKQVILKKIWI